MERSAKTVSAIKTLGYPGGSCLARCRCDELPCPLVSWLSAELRAVCPELRDSCMSGKVLLVGELRQLLSSLFYPLMLTTEVLEPSVLSNVTEFLVAELQAARIIKHMELHPEEHSTGEETVKDQRVEGPLDDVAESCQGHGDSDALDTNRRKAEMQAEWILILRALGLDASSQFDDVLSQVKSMLSQLPDGDMTSPLLNSPLSSEHWMKVKEINQILSDDYKCRRHMMIKRFQVTLESFAWGEKQKERSVALASVPPLASLTGSSQVSLSLLLASRADQSFIEPVKAGTSTPIYKTLMGSVPDRGGRPGEIEPPMPSWGERRTQGNRWGKGGGHHNRQRKKKGKKE
ncbi:unnamed protein product [Menidia menidia]|uniref:(Atlantic silverside) hypothetical protein n=1 Tax=Menidia menidia TaxID=238744 RepID=A0A8S4BV63_9TELE|nr:unnamed protein product [Menidia menidia]